MRIIDFFFSLFLKIFVVAYYLALVVILVTSIVVIGIITYATNIWLFGIYILGLIFVIDLKFLRPIPPGSIYDDL